MPSWEEIKAVLDSPYVSQEKKQRLMEAYDEETFNFNDEEEAYASKYIEGYDDGSNTGYQALQDPFTDNGVEDAYNEAVAERDAGESQADTEKQAVTDAQGKLDGTQPPAEGGGGAKDSDELLDLGKPTLDFFSKWIEKAWNKRPGGGTVDFESTIKSRYDENRGIAFAKFLDEAEALGKAHKVVDETMQSSRTELNTLFNEWTGDGATAARVKFEEAVQPDAKELQEHINGATQLIPETVSAVYEAVKTEVDEVLALHRTQVAQAPLEMAEKVLKIARRETEEYDDLLEVAGWIDSVCGSDLSSRLNNDDCCMNDENRDYAYDICGQWCWDSFTPEFQSLLDAFDQACGNAKDTIGQQWDSLATYMDDYTNEFQGGGSPGGQDSGVPGIGDGGTGGGGTGGGTGGGGTGGGVGGGGTGGGTGGGAPSAPEPPAPPEFEDKPEESAAEEPRDKLTVEEGDNKITMTEPDADGDMEISVDDGSGEQKDYQLDFGPDEEAQAEGQTGEPDQAAAPGPQQGAEKVYRPGPDGKIHIEDGNLKITAEQPQGADGPTVVTVDDGTGEPTVYTLGEEESPEQVDDLVGEGESGRVDGLVGEDGRPVDGGEPADEASDDVEIKPAEGSIPDSADGGDTPAAPGEENGDGSGPVVDAVESAATDTPEGGSGGGTPDSETTHAQAAAGGGGADGGGGGGGTGGGGGVAGAVAGNLGDTSQLGAGDQVGVAAPQPAAVGAGLGVAPGGAGEAMGAAAQSAPSGAAGMGGMMGGMGAMGGAGGGQGGDQDRSSNAYRIDGAIFDTGSAASRISGSLGDEGDRSIRFER
jgi:hypothetical protein